VHLLAIHTREDTIILKTQKVNKIHSLVAFNQFVYLLWFWWSDQILDWSWR